jgi:hypothetical protein
MITLPGDIQQDPDWDGKTGFDKHRDSEMDFGEHQRIAFNALQLLEGNLAVADNAAGKKLEKLKEAYEASKPDDVLYISKGIHQPDTNPHMQLKLKRGKASWYTFHLNVSVSDVDIPGLPEKYFHWVGTQFAAVDGTQTACWPLVAAHDTKYQHARRRWSIAPKDVKGTIENIARAARLAKGKADREAKAKLNGSVQLTASTKTDRDLREERDGRKTGRQETAGTTHR